MRNIWLIFRLGTLIFLICIVRGGIQGPLNTAATNGLLCQPRVIMMEKLVEWFAGETEVLGENLPQCPFVHHKPHMLPGREPEPPWWVGYTKADILCIFLQRKGHWLLPLHSYLFKYFKTHFITFPAYASMIRISITKIFRFYDNKITHILLSFR
jgi:hypothetical protein